ncbi:hypothetical protein EFY79_16355 [Hanamia caeni]|jgi:hypothetical protein|uniref:DUF6249 domain-containing protein n=1 Tax=Hanamia caeni TaxID=2294116 RepID=A0A3M9NA50_9BACT|nr:DUF6249 domain-containing protein [Hanamia caeni]RNI34265.1 hypothetical protein EFY79_16355 [Hanamia caeni]
MEAIITVSLFLMIFGIFYLFLSTRNKERLALIEKGVDARIFIKGKSATNNIGKIIILNLALLLMGIGIGVFIGLILSTFTSMNNGAAYSATIFTMAGVGLFIGFYMTKKLDQEKLSDSQTL